MGVYYALVALVALAYVGRVVAVGAGASPKIMDEMLNVLIGFLVFLVYALRSPSVGGDVSRYLERFAQGNALANNKVGAEVGYAALSDALRSLTANEQVLVVAVAALCIGPVAWVIHRMSSDVFLSWVLFIAIGPFTFMFSGLRQAIALSIVFATLPFLARGKIAAPTLLVVIAATFHISALVFLPAVALYRLRLSVPTVLAAVALGVVVLIAGDVVMSAAISLVYENYEIVHSVSYRWMVGNALLWLALATQSGRVRDETPEYSGLYIVVLFGIILMAMAMFGTNVMRGAAYYQQFIVVLAPAALHMLRDARVRALAGFSLAVVALAYMFSTVAASEYRIVPYTFFWES